MRPRSPEKNDAILQATLRLVNKLGFHGISMSKIAKEASVSPATIYIYFENKEALINQLYMQVKEVVARDMLKGCHPGMETRHAFGLVWRNYYYSMLRYSDEFQFLEQFSNSPYITNISREEGQRQFGPFIRFFDKAMEKGDIQTFSFNMVYAFFIAPIASLAKGVLATGVPLEEAVLEQAIENTWQSMKTKAV